MQRFNASLNQKLQTEGAKEEGGGGGRWIKLNAIPNYLHHDARET